MSDYFTVESSSDNIRNSAYVKAYIFPSHIQAVGVSYERHFRTVPELEKEISQVKESMKKPISNEEHLELEERLKRLERLLSDRRRTYKTRTKRSKTRTDNMKSLKRSQKSLMLYLYGNFDVPYALMGTMTYREKVFDMAEARKDFKKFRKKFYKKFPKAVWIAIFEYHEDGSIHIHFVFRNATRCNS